MSAIYTADDIRHLRGLLNDPSWSGVVHPFTAMRWQALGWTRATVPMGFERPGQYEWTEAGIAALALARAPERAAISSTTPDEPHHTSEETR